MNNKSFVFSLTVSFALFSIALFLWYGKPRAISSDTVTESVQFIPEEKQVDQKAQLEKDKLDMLSNHDSEKKTEKIINDDTNTPYQLDEAPAIEQYKQVIYQDENSTYISELSSTEGNYTEYVFSSYSLFKPTHEQLNSGIDGCSISGIYVDYGATLSVVSHNADDAYVYHYICEYHAALDTYFVEQYEPQTVIQSSIKLALGDLELVDSTASQNEDYENEPDVTFATESDEYQPEEF